jgi:hypothetical protein
MAQIGVCQPADLPGQSARQMIDSHATVTGDGPVGAALAAPTGLARCYRIGIRVGTVMLSHVSAFWLGSYTNPLLLTSRTQN